MVGAVKMLKEELSHERRHSVKQKRIVKVLAWSTVLYVSETLDSTIE